MHSPEYPFRNPDLPLKERVDDLVGRLTTDEKINQMCQYQDELPRLGIAKYKHGTEAAHGIAWLGEATAFPQPFGLACTWDEELLREVGRVIGTEARGFFARDPALNGLTLWAPTVDLLRDPRWGRTDEGYGEDPIHAGKMAAALVRGIQGDDPFYVRAVASPKHFIGNNNEIGRGDRSVSLDPRNRRESYLKAFELTFREGGALSMMTSYNAVNGVPANLNPDINAIVKQEWGMDGFVVSDAGDVLGTVNDHKYMASYAEAVAASIRSGIDSITDDHGIVKQAIRDALRDGLLDEADLDTALRNTFRVRMRLGEFDPPERNPYAAIGESAILAPEHRAVSLEAARKNIVLLKNDGALPLPHAMAAANGAVAETDAATSGKAGNASFGSLGGENASVETPGDGNASAGSLGAENAAAGSGRVAVIGPLADIVYRDWYSGTLPYAVTPLQAIRSRLEYGGGYAAAYAYAEGIDRVRLSVDGRYVRIREDGKLAADASVEQAETFAVTDWGWRAHTLVAESTGLYLTTDDTHLTADSREIFGWFTKEAFLVDRLDDHNGRRWRLQTWNDAPVGVTEDGLLRVDNAEAVARSTLGSPEEHLSSAAQASEPKLPPLKRVLFDVEVVVDGVSAAAETAAGADIAVVFVGNHPLVNGKETIDRPGLQLPASQRELIRRTAAANPNTVVVIVGSYPFALGDIADLAKSVLYTSHAGPELGNAVADVLFGTFSPAGRLNMTWHRSADELPDIMEYDLIRAGRTYRYFEGESEFPFGHGLTYTRFSYETLRLGSKTLQEGGFIDVDVTIRNDGIADSDEVVQLYGTTLSSRVKRPFKQLLAFKRVPIPAGTAVTVSFRIHAEDLAFWDVTRERWCVETAPWTLAAGSSSGDLRVEASLAVVGETVPPRDLTRRTLAMNYDDYAHAYLYECTEDKTVSAVRAQFGAWLRFEDADFPEGATRFEARVFGSSAARIGLRIVGADGQDIDEGAAVRDRNDMAFDKSEAGLITDASPAPSEWRILSLPIAVPSGRHNVTLTLHENLAINWFKFE